MTKANPPPIIPPPTIIIHFDNLLHNSLRDRTKFEKGLQSWFEQNETILLNYYKQANIIPTAENVATVLVKHFKLFLTGQKFAVFLTGQKFAPYIKNKANIKPRIAVQVEEAKDPLIPFPTIKPKGALFHRYLIAEIFDSYNQSQHTSNQVQITKRTHFSPHYHVVDNKVPQDISADTHFTIEINKILPKIKTELKKAVMDAAKAVPVDASALRPEKAVADAVEVGPRQAVIDAAEAVHVDASALRPEQAVAHAVEAVHVDASALRPKQAVTDAAKAVPVDAVTHAAEAVQMNAALRPMGASSAPQQPEKPPPQRRSESTKREKHENPKNGTKYYERRLEMARAPYMDDRRKIQRKMQTLRVLQASSRNPCNCTL